MQNVGRRALRMAAAAACCALVSGPLRANALTVYVVDSGDTLSRLDSATPGTLFGTVPITGLVTGDHVEGIDFRPANGRLYALGHNGISMVVHLYRLNPTTGLATQVGGNIPVPQSSGASSDSTFGFDFDPVLDQIRVTGIFMDNFRLDPDSGAVVAADTALAANFIAGAAYDRNASGLGATTLFGINASADTLVRIGGVDGNPSPNGGALTTIGSLGVDTSVLVGFDIASPAEGGTALAALYISGVQASRLFRINLATGEATLIGTIGSGTPTIHGLAIAPAFRGGAAPSVSRLGLVILVSLLVTVGIAGLSRRSVSRAWPPTNSS
jgi:Domain of unknown function (DUF4394)